MTLGFILCSSASARLLFLPRYPALLKNEVRRQKAAKDDHLKVKLDGGEHLETTQRERRVNPPPPPSSAPSQTPTPGGIPPASPSKPAPEIRVQNQPDLLHNESLRGSELCGCLNKAFTVSGTVFVFSICQSATRGRAL